MLNKISRSRDVIAVEKVGRRGLEPRTYGLKVRSSTIELATRRAHECALQVN